MSRKCKMEMENYDEDYAFKEQINEALAASSAFSSSSAWDPMDSEFVLALRFQEMLEDEFRTPKMMNGRMPIKILISLYKRSGRILMNLAAVVEIKKRMTKKKNGETQKDPKSFAAPVQLLELTIGVLVWRDTTDCSSRECLKLGQGRVVLA